MIIFKYLSSLFRRLPQFLCDNTVHIENFSKSYIIKLCLSNARHAKSRKNIKLAFT